LTFLQEIIPEAKLSAVERALMHTVNTTDVAEIALLNGGLSTSLVYYFTNNGNAYVMRVIMQTDPFNDPAHLFACTVIAASIGVAPAVYYTDAADGIMITGYIEHTNLRSGFPSADILIRELAIVIKSIHAAPLFPKKMNFFNTMDTMMEHFTACGLLPENIATELYNYYTEIRTHYPIGETDIVSSHNDLNPGNILFDGRKIWVIDWDSACQNDRYVDLAVVANSFVTSEARETTFLTTYFGSFPDEHKRARFFLMKQACYLLHSMVIFKLALETQPSCAILNFGICSGDLKEISMRLGNGSLLISSFEGKILYAKALLSEAMDNMRSQRFAQALMLLADI